MSRLTRVTSNPVFGILIIFWCSASALSINDSLVPLLQGGIRHGFGRSLTDVHRAVAKHSSCPTGCQAHATCDEEVGRCDCPRHFTGPACATEVKDMTEICTKYSLLIRGECRMEHICFNQCNGRGKCVNGICHCQPGYWGMDCSINWGPDGKPQLLDGKYQPRRSGVKVYVYELPANMTSWFSLARMDRPLHLLLWQRMMSAGIRTLDGNKADYFYIPVNLRGSATAAEHMEYALWYIRNTWPWWSKDNGHRHFALAPGDMGINDFPGKVLEDNRDAFTNLTWLSHWGLVEDHPFTGWKKAHRPGKDIVIPALIPPRGFHESPLNPANVAAAKAEGRDIEHEKKGLLFFAGTICGDHHIHPNETTGQCNEVHPHYSMGVRQAVYLHHHNRRGFKLVVRSNSYMLDIAAHKFCLAPVGGGYGKRQMHSVLMGCVPVLIADGVLQPFEPELDWTKFSISVEEKDIPTLHIVLASVSKEQHDAMKKRLRCMAQHMFYSSSLGAILGEDGRYDAFEMLMEILRVRRDHPGVPPEKYTSVDEHFRKFVNCDLDGPEAVPLCTYGQTRQFPDRPACGECPHEERHEGVFLSEAGGMLCCMDPDILHCPRVWS